MPTNKRSSEPLVEVRDSPVHGRGVFALRRMRKGQRIIEYIGERISHSEADTRYDERSEHPHVLLFTVDKHIVIDGGIGGNDARFINHSCDPNCDTCVQDGRVFVEALRTIKPGEELLYDYQLDRPGRYTKKVLEQYRCRCGSPKCRGTMLAPRALRKPKPKPTS